MAEIAGISLGTIGLIQRLDKLIRVAQDSGSGDLDDLFGELPILQSVLVESKVMIDELISPPPSLLVALQRCQLLQAQLIDLIRHTGLEDAANRVKKSSRLKLVLNEDKLRRVVTGFKSAVLLFRDIATDTLTHHMLRTIPQSSTIHGDLYFNNSMRGTVPNSSTTLDGDLHGNNSMRDTVPDSSQGQHAIPKTGTEGQHDRDTLRDNVTLFNATISVIVDAERTELPHPIRQNGQSGFPCACGRQRLGVWFPVRGKFDSGSNDDFISEDVIRRAGLEDFVFEAEEAVSLRIFGVTFDFQRRIVLNWQLNNHENSYTRTFWVAPNADNFDLIIGEPWMMEHGYENIANLQSRKKSSFFGLFKLRLPSRSKEQSRRERATADRVRNEAIAEIKRNRQAALTPRSLQSQTSNQAMTSTHSGIDPQTNTNMPHPASGPQAAPATRAGQSSQTATGPPISTGIPRPRPDAQTHPGTQSGPHTQTGTAHHATTITLQPAPNPQAGPANHAGSSTQPSTSSQVSIGTQPTSNSQAGSSTATSITTTNTHQSPSVSLSTKST